MLNFFLWLTQGGALGFSAAATPGPFQTYLLAQTARNGFWRTLPAALAPLLSDGPIIALALLVVAQLPLWGEGLIQLAGGGFILTLAWQTWRSFQAARAADPQETPAVVEDVHIQSIRQATLINLLNPNPYIFWFTVGAPFVTTAWRESASYAVGFILGMYGMLVGGFALLIALFAAMGRLDPRLNRWMSGLSVVALLGVGGVQLWLGISKLTSELGWL